MMDGNTAALSRHESAQARAQEIHDLYETRALAELLDDLMAGRQIKGSGRRHTLLDVLDDRSVEEILDMEDAANLITATFACRQEALEDRLQKMALRVEEWAREWLASSEFGQDAVALKVEALDEAAREKEEA